MTIDDLYRMGYFTGLGGGEPFFVLKNGEDEFSKKMKFNFKFFSNTGEFLDELSLKLIELIPKANRATKTNKEIYKTETFSFVDSHKNSIEFKYTINGKYAYDLYKNESTYCFNIVFSTTLHTYVAYSILIKNDYAVSMMKDGLPIDPIEYINVYNNLVNASVIRVSTEDQPDITKLYIATEDN